MNRRFSHKTLLGLSLAVIVQSALSGCSGNNTYLVNTGSAGNNPQTVQWPIAENVYTTAQQQVLPVAVPSGTPSIRPNAVSQYAQYGYSSWQVGPGLPYVPRTDFAPGYGSPNVARLLSFFSMSDIHIADKESPAQPIYIGLSNTPTPSNDLSSAYSPILLSTTHVLDAAVQTINVLHRTTPFDFGISLGDDVNNSQYNELRWFIDVLDGKVITPSTGAHAGANTIDYQKPFQAVGIDKSIPWYQVMGNHDQFWMGSAHEDIKTMQAHVGSTILNMSSDANPANGGVDAWGAYMGVIDGSTPYGDVIGAGPSQAFAIPPTVIPDESRRSLTTYTSSTTATSSSLNWMSEFFLTTSNPVGHGFTHANLLNDSACYSFVPKSDIPIKVIVLDDTVKGTGVSNYAQGTLDVTRRDWLFSELDAGQNADQLMIIAAHIPILPQMTFTNTQTYAELWRNDADAPGLMQRLHQYSNLILWISGHRHVNVVTPQPFNASDPTVNPEFSFWEVETSALRDFPQEFRTFDIRRNQDNNISIFITDVDPAVREGSPAAKSRGYAIGAARIFEAVPLSDTTSQAYNAELVKILSSRMRGVIQNLGTPIN